MASPEIDRPKRRDRAMPEVNGEANSSLKTAATKKKSYFWLLVLSGSAGIMLWQSVAHFWSMYGTDAEVPSKKIASQIEEASSKFGKRFNIGNSHCSSSDSTSCRWKLGNVLSLSVTTTRSGSEGYISVGQQASKNVSADQMLLEQACRALVATRLPEWSSDQVSNFVNAHLAVGRSDRVRQKDTLFDFDAPKDGSRYCIARIGY